MNYDWLDDYFLSKKGVVKEFKVEWDCYRFMLDKKIVGLLSAHPDKREIVSLKCEPSFGLFLRDQYKDIIPGYHLNKLHWNSVYLDGEVPGDILKDMIDQSYDLILKSLSKKLQKEILEK